MSFGSGGSAFWVVVTLSVLTGGAAVAVTLVRQAMQRAKARWTTAFLAAVPDAVVGVSAEGRIVTVNRQSAALFGYTEEELVGQSLEVLLPERFRDTHVGQRQQYHAHPRHRGMADAMTLVGRRKDGSEVPVDIALSQLPRADGAVTMAFVRDVTVQRRTFEQLADANRRRAAELHERQQFRGLSELLQTLQSRDEVRSVLSLHMGRLFPATSGAVYLYSPSRNDLEAWVQWGPVTGHERFLVGECWALRLGKAYDAHVPDSMVPCAHLPSGSHGYCCVPLVADGETLGLLHVRAAVLPAESGPSLAWSLAEDVPSRAVRLGERLGLPLANFRLRETLQNQSIRDGLTGVFNRRYMEESLAREMSRALRHTAPLSVVMLDLDHFKALNDTYGHAVGDAVLTAFGRLLAASVREEDIVCRYGGEEFVIILPEATAVNAVARTDALRAAWAQVTVDGGSGNPVSITFSGGVAGYPDAGATVERLLREADRALYRAKAEGRNRTLTAGPVPASRASNV